MNTKGSELSEKMKSGAEEQRDSDPLSVLKVIDRLEIGLETHPIFINESGRHWYTALNTHRYFKNNFDETTRVWTNADRGYNWMLRHFPFIRQDYARIRSDEYPIRLWTMAVFLFGALPILRKRSIERLVIGDEYDTTRRLSYKGEKIWEIMIKNLVEFVEDLKSMTLNEIYERKY